MFATIRRYDGVDQNRIVELTTKVNETLVPKLSKLDGFKGRSNRHRHRAEMHGHMIALSDQYAFAIEDCARVIAPLFDVRREGRPPQTHAHLFGDG